MRLTAKQRTLVAKHNLRLIAVNPDQREHIPTPQPASIVEIIEPEPPEWETSR